jgi:histidinol-phosphate/aromatic aminotransferase/cobyric acid decarboxylase-like protein
MKWFTDRGLKPTDSQANFLFVEIGRPAKEFREACKEKGVLVARDFPPLEKTMCRISLGTMEEMQKAVAVFGEVLAKQSTAVGRVEPRPILVGPAPLPAFLRVSPGS